LAGLLPRLAAALVVIAAELGLAACGTNANPSGSALQPTLGFQAVDGGRVAMQSGSPVPGFGRQRSPSS